MTDWLLLPVVAISVVFALIYNTAIHLFLRLGYRHFLRHWVLGLTGMAVGYAFAVRTKSPLPMLGDMHLIESSLACLVLLLLAGAHMKLGEERAGPPGQV